MNIKSIILWNNSVLKKITVTEPGIEPVNCESPVMLPLTQTLKYIILKTDKKNSPLFQADVFTLLNNILDNMININISN